jgi:hypothetical protein
LATGQQLPALGNRKEGFDLVISILTRTGTMPNYQRSFNPDPDPVVDDAVDAVAQNLAVWASRTMKPAMMVDYLQVLGKHKSKVPEITQGRVSEDGGIDYINQVFREILTLRSSMFADGELLRRVVRYIPEW